MVELPNPSMRIIVILQQTATVVEGRRQQRWIAHEMSPRQRNTAAVWRCVLCKVPLGKGLEIPCNMYRMSRGKVYHEVPIDRQRYRQDTTSKYKRVQQLYLYISMEHDGGQSPAQNRISFENKVEM